MANESQAQHRTPDDVQKEIAETRAELDETLDEIGRRLSPHEIKERVMDSAKKTAVEVRDTVQQNHMPLLVVGGVAAAAFLLHNRMQAREIETRAERVRDVWDRVAVAFERNGRAELESRLGDVAHTISDVAHTTRDSVVNLAGEVMPTVTRATKDLMSSIEEVPAFPLLAVGLGIAAVMLASRAYRA